VLILLASTLLQQQLQRQAVITYTDRVSSLSVCLHLQNTTSNNQQLSSGASHYLHRQHLLIFHHVSNI